MGRYERISGAYNKPADFFAEVSADDKLQTKLEWKLLAQIVTIAKDSGFLLDELSVQDFLSTTFKKWPPWGTEIPPPPPPPDTTDRAD